MNVKNIVLGIAIIILTIFVSVYGINTFYQKPEYNNFCGDKSFPLNERLGEKQICPAVCIETYEIKNNECVLDKCGSGCGPDSINTFEKLKQCEIALTGKNCYSTYDDEMKKYSKNVFLIAVPLGILIIALGVFFFSLESVGVGLMGGGIGTLIFGIGRYWGYADNWLKFSISLVGLIAIIGISYWFNSKNWNIWKKK